MRRAETVKKITGLPLGYGALLRYIRIRSDLRASTLRGTKSAVMFALALAGKKMKQDKAEELDRVLDGLEVIKQVPERIRGAPRPDQVDALVEAAMAKDKGELAAAIIVGFGIGARARDIIHLRARDFDKQAKIVWVERKGRALLKTRYGTQVERPIMTKAALVVLEGMCKLTPKGRLFKGVTAEEVTRHVQEIAERDNWDPDQIWSGIHNLRHGAAAAFMHDAYARLRQIGNWTSNEGSANYSREGRIGPKDRRRHHKYGAKRKGILRKSHE
jgi:integrase